MDLQSLSLAFMSLQIILAGTSERKACLFGKPRLWSERRLMPEGSIT